MKTVEIIKIHNENSEVKTIFFKDLEKASPGQFYMIWIPGIDEIPMSVSYINKDVRSITLRKVGDATKHLFNYKINDKIGIRGPYGNGFELIGKDVLFIGGGTGIAMLAPAIEKAIKKKINCTVVLGAKTKNELFFKKRIKETGAKVIITSDDGSIGRKGFATDTLGELIKNNNFDQIYTCGPELMMKKIVKTCKDIPIQASLERYMKCGFGICGQCSIGNGLRVCKEGPVFDGETLKNIKDFGNFKRDSSGRKVKL